MSEQLQDLEPKNVMHFFEEICNIPHPSGYTKKISDYLVKFAEERNLSVTQDDFYNVIIKKPASVGRKKDPTVILQGHMDMVGEKTKESTFDFQTQGLELEINGDFISAKNTTLGGDDGIAVAYALAILDDDTISHPALEVIITVDEEIGMLGAKEIDLTQINGRLLLNIDSEEEGIFLAGCSGGLTAQASLPVNYEKKEGNVLKLVLSGLTGGHSGVEIHKGRGNSNKIMARLLTHLWKKYPFSLSLLEGGLKDNAIPRETTAVLVWKDGNLENREEIERQLCYWKDILQKEYQHTDSSLQLEYSWSLEVVEGISLTETKNVLFYLYHVPDGVLHMSGNVEGLVETSMNLGIVFLNKEVKAMQAQTSIRSEVGSRKMEYYDKIVDLIEKMGGSVCMQGNYPAWEYRKDSLLRPIMLQSYRNVFGKEAKVETVHAGLECGYFLEKCPDMDAVSFGPDIYDIHTTEERLSISSVQRTYQFIIEILKNIHSDIDF